MSKQTQIPANQWSTKNDDGIWCNACGYHPTMPSAVGVVLEALAAIKEQGS